MARYVTVVLELDDDDTTSPEVILESIPWGVTNLYESTFDGTALD